MVSDVAVDGLPTVSIRSRSWLGHWWSLVRWSLTRHQYLLPAFTVVQALLSVAIVFGLALLVPRAGVSQAQYLSAGSWTLGIIAVGCVLAPQTVSTAKQEGLLAYQKTLPVPRTAILLADAVVWSIAAMPGIAVAVVAGTLRFDLRVHITALTIASLLLALLATTSVGFAIAYWLPMNATAIVTQVIMIGGLLFSPITFPASRLPGWAVTLHQFLPFAPLGDLIRSSAFGTGSGDARDFAVVLCWAVAGYLAALLALRQRN